MKLPRSQNQCPHFSTKPCDRPRSENHCPPTDGLGSFEMNGHQDSGTACDASRQGEIPMEFTYSYIVLYSIVIALRKQHQLNSDHCVFRTSIDPLSATTIHTQSPYHRATPAAGDGVSPGVKLPTTAGLPLHPTSTILVTLHGTIAI